MLSRSLQRGGIGGAGQVRRRGRFRDGILPESEEVYSPDNQGSRFRFCSHRDSLTEPRSHFAEDPQPGFVALCGQRSLLGSTVLTLIFAICAEWEENFVLLNVEEGAVFSVQLFNERRLPAMLDEKCFLGESLIPIRLEYSCKISTYVLVSDSIFSPLARSSRRPERSSAPIAIFFP